MPILWLNLYVVVVSVFICMVAWVSKGEGGVNGVVTVQWSGAEQRWMW